MFSTKRAPSDMILTAWVFLGVMTFCAHGMAPPIVGALEKSDRDSSDHDETIGASPDKRILKYLLPSTHNWGESGANVPVPIGQEGSKRGYVDRNFLRFGRSGLDKKNNRNFLRFGRGGSEDYDDEDEPGSSSSSSISEESSSVSAEKRNRNFLRFGRDPNRNFLRFGRPDLEEFGLEGSPLAFAQGLEEDGPTEEEKRDAHYLRNTRGNKNFLRFGRNYNKNFLRFGRSVDVQTFCEDCEEENLMKHSSGTASSTSSASSLSSNLNVKANKKLSHDEEYVPSEVAESSATEKSETAHRSKRSAPMFYDYAVLTSHGPSAWARDFQPSEDDDIEDSGLDDLQEVSKRAYNRNFLRFGRDRNFLRFGRRDSSEGPSMMMMPAQYPRFIRAPNRNFIRFG